MSDRLWVSLYLTWPGPLVGSWPPTPHFYRRALASLALENLSLLSAVLGQRSPPEPLTFIGRPWASPAPQPLTSLGHPLTSIGQTPHFHLPGRAAPPLCCASLDRVDIGTSLLVQNPLEFDDRVLP